MGRIPLEFTPDGKLLLTSGPTGDLSLYDAADGRPVRQFARPAAPVADACVSPDGTRMAAACDNGAAVLWDMAAAAPLRTLAANNKALNAVAFTPDGKRLAAAGEDQKVRVWDVASGMVLMILSGHRTGVKDVAVSPDGRFFVSVGGQYRGAPLSEVKLWDAATGEPLRTLEGHTSLVTAAAFFPNGRRLATASDDRTIKIWDHNNGDDVFTLRGHTSGVASLAVSRDGQQIVSGSIDCTARVWTADPPSTEVEQVRRRAAVELVQTLFETHMLKAEVLAALQSDATLPPALRAVALEIAARRGEDAQGLYENAWLAILRPAASPEVYHEALQRLEAACRIVENDRARWIEYQHALCLALHRCGRHDQALQGLARLADERASAGGPLPLVSLDLAVRAMASQKLGRFADARAALDDLRARLQAAGPAAEQQALLFLAEAEAVVHE